MPSNSEPADENTRRIADGELRGFVEAVFEASGLTPTDAATVADSLVASDLRGTHSHGVIRTPMLVDRLLRNGAKPDARPAIIQESPGTAVLDGDRALGAITAAHAMQVAIDKAKKQGIAMVSARNSDFYGASAHYALMAPPCDMIGIAWTNGFPGMTAWGSRSNAIGNNPVAFAAPSGSHGPISLDMALSVAAGGRVRVAAKKGEKIPLDWLLDRDGVPTDDPNALTAGGALLPLGYKGFGLAVFGEILCGALAGARMLGEVPAWHKDTDDPVGNGHVHIAIDIARFIDPQAFKTRVDAMVETLKSAPTMPGVESILMPGERSWRTHQANLRDGVPVPEPVAADLRALAARLGVEPPRGLIAN